jgi:uncharacterized protein DUF4154
MRAADCAETCAGGAVRLRRPFRMPRVIRAMGMAAILLVPLVTALLLGVAFRAPLRAQESLENDVKAAFLYNFSKFVEWPVPPDRTGEPFRLCVLADADFARAVDRTIDGQAVEGRKLERIEPRSPDDARRCAILYVGRRNLAQAAPLLASVRQMPVLTVGDDPHFVRQGGAIEFVLEDNRVRFDVNTLAAERSGLKVSSKLLRVARTVIATEPR